MKTELIIIFIVSFVFAGVIGIHEYEHYKDYKDLNCTNISLVFNLSVEPVGLKAWCPNVTKAQQLSDERHKK